MIQTPRLKLVPATIPVARAEVGDRTTFARLLGAAVPDNWPPETLADALHLFLEWMEAAPNATGWFGWYALAEVDGASTLVAGGGFLGPPQAGTVQMGYSVLPQFQRKGYATELAAALVAWALGQPDVSIVAAETEWANPASVRVLEKAGFTLVGPSADGNGQRFECRRSRGLSG